ncbi:MAG: SIS domain-containing protein [Acidimicrobiia bacterium]
MLLHDEIFEQPDALARVLAHNPAVAGLARDLLTGAGTTHAVIAARGTSDNAARYAKYVWGTELSVPVTLAAPSLYTRYDDPPNLEGAVVVGISQSGQSPDLLAVLEEAKRQARPTIAIVNEIASPLAELANVVVPLHAGTEHSVAATKSYTTSLIAIAMIAGGGSSLSAVPGFVRDVLALEPQIAAESARLGPIDRAVVLGRGYNHCTAFEWALKLQEMAYVFAHGFSTADFAHGPFAILEPGFPVLAAVPDGPTAADSFDILRRARDEGGAHVSVFSSVGDAGIDGVTTPTVPEAVSPMTFITCAQLFTLHMALARGIDPETPRGLRKVTKTS